MEGQRRSLGQVIFHAVCGAVLAGVSALSFMFCVTGIQWAYVAFFSLAGFVFAALYGDKAIDFLKEVWQWS